MRCAECRAALVIAALPPESQARCGRCGTVFRVPAGAKREGRLAPVDVGLDDLALGGADCARAPREECAAPSTRASDSVTPTLSQARLLLEAPPEKIGPYRLEGEIARGGTAVVYRGRHETIGKPVAIKLVLPGMAEEKELGRRLFREALALARFRHPHIVPVLDAGQTEAGLAYLVMEFVKGEDLSQKLKREGPLDWKAALAILAQVIEGVDFAHAQGVIHRDLKPGNVLLDSDGRAQIVDFGLARDERGASQLTRTGVALGTPAYMPPEQARGERDKIGRRADVFSLGAILYAMLAGRPPFQGATLMEVLYKVVHEDPPPLRVLAPRVPAEVEAISQLAMRKDPALRYASAYQMLQDVRACLAGDLPPVAWAGRGSRWKRWARRIGLTGYRLPAAAVAAVLLSGVLLAGGERTWRVRRAVSEGQTFLASQRWDDADDRFVQAQRLDPEDAEAYLGRQEVRRRRAEKAVEEGRARLALGRLDEAEERFIEAQRFEPDHAQAAQGRLDVRQKREAAEKGRWKEVKSAMRLSPERAMESLKGIMDKLGDLGGDLFSMATPAPIGVKPGPAAAAGRPISVTVASRTGGTRLRVRAPADGRVLAEGLLPLRLALAPGAYPMSLVSPDLPEKDLVLIVPEFGPPERKVLLDAAGVTSYR